MKGPKAKLLTFLAAISAAIGYGGWAVYANFEYGAQAWLVAGTIQAIYAFLSTLSITHVARWAFVKYKCGTRGIFAGFSMSFIVMLAIPLAVHNAFGTPDIWQTILPGLIWGSIYLLGLLIAMEIAKQKAL